MSSAEAPISLNPLRLNKAPASLHIAMALIAIVTISPSMRTGATTIGPLMDDITRAFGTGAWAAGLLAALPCLTFAIFGLCAVPLAQKIGLSGAIAISAGISVIGLAARPFAPEIWSFLALSACAMVGPAVGNVLVPAWIKEYAPFRAVLLLSVFGTIMPIGATMGAAVSVPLTHVVGSWHISLALWAIPAALPLVVWTFLALRIGVDRPSRHPGGHNGGDHANASVVRRSLWHAPTAVLLTCLFGTQSANAYVQMGFLPQVLVSQGYDAQTAGALASLVNAPGILGGLIMPLVVAKARHLPLIGLSFGVITAAGWIGLNLAPQIAVLWAFLLGLGGFCFPMIIALLPARTRSAEMTARLSGMVQPWGYVFAAFGPVIIGVVLDMTGSMSTILWLMTASAGIMMVLAYFAARPTVVDDEVAGVSAPA
ncbi:MAG: MFS transporter [Actinomycetaceae bacterium]|nr:MFS transporter [Actinomycetaceae bacterium]